MTAKFNAEKLIEKIGTISGFLLTSLFGEMFCTRLQGGDPVHRQVRRVVKYVTRVHCG